MATILIIDDDASIRALLRRVLEGAGHSVLDSSNGQAGLSIYRTKSVDLVITDVYMPELSGFDLILEIAHEFPDARVIAISGEVSEQDNILHATKLLGIRQIFKKPLSLEKFLAAVEYELQH